MIVGLHSDVLVLYGRVTEIRPDQEITTILLEGLECEKQLRLFIDYKKSFVDKMKLKVGSRILVSCDSNERLLLVRDGCCFPDYDFHLKGRTFLYSGDLFLSGRLAQKSMHYILCTITGFRKKTSMAGTYYEYDVIYRENKSDVNAIVDEWGIGGLTPREIGDKAVFVGSKRDNYHSDIARFFCQHIDL